MVRVKLLSVRIRLTSSNLPVPAAAAAAAGAAGAAGADYGVPPRI